MAKKKGTVVYLSEEDKNNLETIANHWGISQSSAVQRLIREYINTSATKVSHSLAGVPPVVGSGVARAASLSALK